MWQPGHAFGASLVLCAVMGFAYARQKKWLLFPAGVLYAFSAASATFLIWSPSGQVTAVAFVTLTLAAPALGLCLFLVDYLWAPFCLEMRYMVILWWLLAPLAIPLNMLGMILTPYL